MSWPEAFAWVGVSWAAVAAFWVWRKYPFKW
jgi:hypothetical protein